MTLEQIIEKRRGGYAWSLGSGKAILTKNGQYIIARNVTQKFMSIACLGSIDAFCFGIFGPNGKDRWQYRRFLTLTY